MAVAKEREAKVPKGVAIVPTSALTDVKPPEFVNDDIGALQIEMGYWLPRNEHFLSLIPAGNSTEPLTVAG